jgi:hypothetical protein
MASPTRLRYVSAMPDDCPFALDQVLRDECPVLEEHLRVASPNPGD